MATSPLRPLGDLFDQRDEIAASVPLDSDVRRGGLSALSGMSAAFTADEALRAEVARDPAFAAQRDRALELQNEAAMYAPRVGSLRDVHGIGDAIDFAQAGAPQAAVSTLPSLAGGIVGTALTRNPRIGGFLGALGPAYWQERGETALGQYSDPTLSQAPVDVRDDAATAKGVINAGLESIVPAGLAATMFKKPVQAFGKEVLRNSIEEGLTETAQQGVGFAADKYVDPNKQLDPWDLADAGALGVLGGGTLTAVTKTPGHLLSKALPEPIIDPASNTAPEYGFNPDVPLGPDDSHAIRTVAEKTLRDLDAKATGTEDREVIDPDTGAKRVERGTPGEYLTPDEIKLREFLTKNIGDVNALRSVFKKEEEEAPPESTGDFVTDTVNKMKKAASGAGTSAVDFLKRTFATNDEDDAETVLKGDEDPELAVDDPMEAEAVFAKRDEENTARTTGFVEKLLKNPDLSEDLKAKILEAGVNPADPDNQKFIARTLLVQGATKRLREGLTSLTDLSKKWFDAAKTTAEDLAAKSGDPDKKMNLQSIPIEEAQPLVNALAQALGPDGAVSAPRYARQLLALSARLGQVDVPREHFEAITGVLDDLEKIDQDGSVMEALRNTDGGALSDALGRIARTPGAQADVRNNAETSFLSTMLVQPSVSPSMTKQIARLIDEVSVKGVTPHNLERIKTGLTAAFGTRARVKTVLDYYGTQRRKALEASASDGSQDDRPDPQDNQELSPDEQAGLSVKDGTPKSTFKFADPKTQRPFRVFAGSKLSDGRNRREAVQAGINEQGVTAGGRFVPVKYSQYVQETGKDPEAEVKHLAAELKGRISEQERKSTKEDRSAQINQLKGELELMRHQYKEGGAQAVLDMYEVLKESGGDKNELVADDEMLKKFDTLTNQRDARSTRIVFKRKDGKRMALSAESMWKTMGDLERQNGGSRGDSIRDRARRLFNEAVASVLARDDIADIVTEGDAFDNVVIDRALNIRVKNKKDPEFAQLIKDALEAAEGSLKNLEATLKSVVDEYTNEDDRAAGNDDIYESRREEVEDILQQNIAQLQLRLPALKKSVPAQAVAKEKLRLYKDAMQEIKAVKYERSLEEVQTMGGDFQNDRTDDTGPRFFEEDTGEAIGQETRGKKNQNTPSARAAKLEAEAKAAEQALADLKAKEEKAAARKRKRERADRDDEVDEQLAAQYAEDSRQEDGDIEGFGDPIPQSEVNDTIDELLSGKQAEQLGAASEKLHSDFQIRVDEGVFYIEYRGDHSVIAFRPRLSGAEAAPNKKFTFIGAKADPDGAFELADFIDAAEVGTATFTASGNMWFIGPDGMARRELDPTATYEAVKKKLAQPLPLGSLAKKFLNGSFLSMKVKDLKGVDISHYLEGTDILKMLPKLAGITVVVGDSADYAGSLTVGAKDRVMHLSPMGSLHNRMLEVAKVRGTTYSFIRDVTPLFKAFDYAGLAALYKTSEEEIRRRAMLATASTFMHELQHAVQQLEGFASGGNPTTALLAKYGQLEAADAASKKGDKQAYQDILQATMGLAVQDIGPDQTLEDYASELYYNLTGEVEANDVQDRLKLSPKLRNETLPALFRPDEEYITIGAFEGALSMAMSALNPKPGRPAKMTPEKRKALLDEIKRLRGPKILVAFKTFAQIGGSGSYTISNNKLDRLIEIAVNSLNPMSVAWHESLHDFFATLGSTPEERQIKQDLINAANAPHVLFKLKRLLKDHPEALEQLDDPEERVAYMYQFWAEGQLTLTSKSDSIFHRFARMVREILGIVSRGAKVQQVLEAFHDGKLADPNLVAAALKDIHAQTLGDKLRTVAGPIMGVSEALFTSTTDRLRNTNIKPLQELADLYHREPDREVGGKLPFMQARAQAVGQYLNRLQRILGSDASKSSGPTAVELRTALENMQQMKAPSSPLEHKLAEFLKDMREYMVKSGVKRFDPKTKKWGEMGNVPNYFPRNWDKNYIRDHEQDFLNVMTPHVGKAQARATYEALTNGDGTIELAENQHSLGYTPFAAAVEDRVFKFITPANAAQFAPFFNKDMVDTLTTYVQQAVHRAEYSSAFGNSGEVIQKKLDEAKKEGATREELIMAGKATMAMEGTLGHDFNPRLKEIMSGIMTYQNIVLLPLALFSSLIDPLGVALRSGDMKEAGKAFMTGMQGVARAITAAGPDEREEMARLLGIIDDQNMLESMGQVYNSMHMSKFMKKVNNTFFKYNGMALWNRRMRVAALSAAQRFVVKNIDNDRYMKELGIEKTDVYVQPDGTIALTEDALKAAGVPKNKREAMAKRLQAGMFKFVDDGVLRPNAAHRPIWGSDPRYQLIFHLKQFTYSFHNTILKRVGHEFKNGNSAPALILASYVPFMIAADLMRGSLTGTLKTNLDLYDIISQGIARSGIMGVGNFGEDAMKDVSFGKLPGSSFLGPSFDHLSTVLNGIMGRASFEQVLERSLPAGVALRGVI